jgi:hypothetical protein
LVSANAFLAAINRIAAVSDGNNKTLNEKAS